MQLLSELPFFLLFLFSTMDVLFRIFRYINFSYINISTYIISLLLMVLSFYYLVIF